MGILSLLSPAKINLFLHVNRQREDKYHELQTVFQFLDYGDEMRFQKREDDQLQLQCDNTNLPETENLIWKAAKLLKQHCQLHTGAQIYLNKRIPMGGGLGGGSSNAATTLLALNKLWNTKLSLEELSTLGLKLGADVPIFIHGHAAFADGVGEQFQPISLDEPWYLVITPPCEVSTADIFQHKNLTRSTPKITIRDFLSSGGQNDCEAITRQLYPMVDDAITWLNQHASARMTGTGSSVFAEFASREEAEQVLRRKPQSFRGFVAKAKNVSPCHSALQKSCS